MLENKALDIVIGLVFIYTLYSLLATTINEFVATIFAYRHRMLEKGLEQMLDGKNYSYYWWDKVANGCIWVFWIFFKKGNTLPEAKDFLQKGELQNLSTGSIKRVKLNSKSKLFAALVTAHPLYTRKAENSFLYKKPAYLESTAFSDILIDLFHTQKNLPLLLKDIEAEIEKHTGVNPDLKNILLVYIRQANGDLTRFKALIENWYDDTMDRVSGWYKRQTQRILFIIGFILAVAFNVNTIKIIDLLATDEKVRTALVANAEKFVEKKMQEDWVKKSQSSPKGQPNTLAGNEEKKEPETATNPINAVAKTDSTPQANPSVPNIQKAASDTLSLEEAKQKLKQIKEFYNNEINDQNKLLGLGWGDYGFMEDTLTFIKDSIANQKELTAGNNQTLGCKLKRPEPPGFFQKIWYVMCNIPQNFIGFLLTALAISLGAPFWFDLLNKLVKLRATGQKPADSRETRAGGLGNQTAGINKRPDPTAKG